MFLALLLLSKAIYCTIHKGALVQIIVEIPIKANKWIAQFFFAYWLCSLFYWCYIYISTESLWHLPPHHFTVLATPCTKSSISFIFKWGMYEKKFFPASWHSLVPGVTFCSLTWYLCSTPFLVVTIPLKIAQILRKSSNLLKWYWDLFYANLRIGRVLSGCQKLSYKQALSKLYCDQRQRT